MTEEGRHLDTVCISVMTLATVLVIATFGLVGSQAQVGGLGKGYISWLVSIALVGVWLLYLPYVGAGVAVLFEVVDSQEKRSKSHETGLLFLMIAGLVVVMAVLTILVPLTFGSPGVSPLK